MNAAADRALEVLVLRGVAWGRHGQVGIKAAMPSFQTMKSSGGLQSCSESRKVASRETKMDRRPRTDEEDEEETDEEEEPATPDAPHDR